MFLIVKNNKIKSRYFLVDFAAVKTSISNIYNILDHRHINHIIGLCLDINDNCNKIIIIVP